MITIVRVRDLEALERETREQRRDEEQDAFDSWVDGVEECEE